MLPPAPPRLSITNGWPSLSERSCATERASMSADPPAGNGTIIVTFRAGQFSATAGPASHPADNTSSAPHCSSLLARVAAPVNSPGKAHPPSSTCFWLRAQLFLLKHREIVHRCSQHLKQRVSDLRCENRESFGTVSHHRPHFPGRQRIGLNILSCEPFAISTSRFNVVEQTFAGLLDRLNQQAA